MPVGCDRAGCIEHSNLLIEAHEPATRVMGINECDLRPIATMQLWGKISFATGRSVCGGSLWRRKDRQSLT